MCMCAYRHTPSEGNSGHIKSAQTLCRRSADGDRWEDTVGNTYRKDALAHRCAQTRPLTGENKQCKTKCKLHE